MKLVGGEPAIIQIFQPGTDEDKPYYLYAGARPQEVDGDGRVTSVRIWIVQCGPLESIAGEGAKADAQHVTTRPYLGLMVKDTNCTAESLEALRNAARESETLGSEGENANHSLRWIRDSWP